MSRTLSRLALLFAACLLLAPTALANDCLPGSNSLAQDLSAALQAHARLSPKRITVRDIVYEELAHGLAYKQEEDFTADDKRLLQSWGFNPDVVQFTGRGGLSVTLFEPLPDSGAVPVIAFRGTEPSQAGDILTDLDPHIGLGQYVDNHDLIALLFDRVQGQVDVVGHSLGGALAQHAATEYPSRVRQVVGFQSPGISRAQAQQFRQLEVKPAVRFHLSRHDFVDQGGQEHLDGEFFLHTPRQSRNPLAAHTDFLLLSEKYRRLREQAGLDAATDARVHGSAAMCKLDPHAEVLYYAKYPRPGWGVAAELVRGSVSQEVEKNERAAKRIWSWIIGR